MAQKGAFLGYNALLGDGSYVENRPSKWQRTLGILNEYNPIPAFERLMKSPMASGGPISEQNISDGLTVAGTVTGGSSLFPKPRNAVNMGIRAFHGSPHSFPPVRLIEMADGTRLYQNMHELADTPQGAKIIQEFPLGRFDMSKIGTGEGAQAYGHGLYFAENEKVAKGYRDALSNMDAPLAVWKRPDGVEIDPLDVPGGIVLLRHDEVNVPFETLLDRAQKELARASSVRNPQLREAQSKKAQEALNWLKSNEGVGLSSHPERGSMYEVNINADPNDFLDWDKPLSEQPEAVQNAFGDIVGRDLSKETGWGKLTGNEALTAVMERNGSLDWPVDANPALRAQYRDNARSKASAVLAGKGIPGIKYLDAGSRGAGDGTRNYVVFDDKLIEIVRKYGIAGASAMLGYNVFQGLNPAQAAELQKADPSARRSGGW